jgi:hypothetical protein
MDIITFLDHLFLAVIRAFAIGLFARFLCRYWRPLSAAWILYLVLRSLYNAFNLYSAHNERYIINPGAGVIHAVIYKVEVSSYHFLPLSLPILTLFAILLEAEDAKTNA